MCRKSTEAVLRGGSRLFYQSSTTGASDISATRMQTTFDVGR